MSGFEPGKVVTGRGRGRGRVRARVAVRARVGVMRIHEVWDSDRITDPNPSLRQL